MVSGNAIKIFLIFPRKGFVPKDFASHHYPNWKGQSGMSGFVSQETGLQEGNARITAHLMCQYFRIRHGLPPSLGGGIEVNYVPTPTTRS
ncbi:hypothetical protein TNCV_3743471 [Trichonephila clavipes]|nr:hypothetical protein TNCV_3743471 [Trichonephila clavipes]